MADLLLEPDAIQCGITVALTQHAHPLPAPERAEEFGASFASLGEASVVLLGEATHGTLAERRGAIDRNRRP
ncbi:MAG: hypothetical protein WCD20_09580 [Rhodomicrobium sp.]